MHARLAGFSQCFFIFPDFDERLSVSRRGFGVALGDVVVTIDLFETWLEMWFL